MAPHRRQVRRLGRRERRRLRASVHRLRNAGRAPVGGDGDFRLRAAPARGLCPPWHSDRPPVHARLTDTGRRAVLSHADVLGRSRARRQRVVGKRSAGVSTPAPLPARAGGPRLPRHRAARAVAPTDNERHLYYMATKWAADGDVHTYFSPYDTPYDAFIAFMNVMQDLEQRVSAELSEATDAGLDTEAELIGASTR